MIPLNHSIVIDLREVRRTNLPLRFLPVVLQNLFVAPPARLVDLIFKTDGCQIWDVLHNLSTIPQHLSPQFDLLVCRTTTTQYSTPDQGPVIIPAQRQGILQPSHRHQQAISRSPSLVPTWLLILRQQFSILFQPGLGHCCHHLISSLPFKFPPPLKQ